MTTTTTAINSGHAFVNIAEEYEEKGEWAKAANAHKQAADQFQQATSEDNETKKTLELLINNHTRIANELLRKAKRAETQIKLQEAQQDTKAIGESYALLSNEENEDNVQETSSDPFNKFWGIVETMVDKLSNPVALASAPVNSNNDVMVEAKETDRIKKEMSEILDSYFVVSDNDDKNKKEENERLKLQVQKLKSQVQALEQKSVESSMLKSSIIQFRNDVHKQAKRLRQTHEANMMTRSAITPTNKNMRILGSSSIEMVNRVRELEEENRNIRVQNRKQEALINKYRERWERLKEGAKKRQPNNTLLRSLASNEPPSVILPSDEI